MSRQQLRRLRKALGLSASPEVGHISDMLRSLRNEVEDFLDMPICTAVVTTPQLVALYREDVTDAFEYIGLQYVETDYWEPCLQQTRAAYANYGFGLCSNNTNPPACRDENRATPEETVMAVLYTEQALTVSLSELKTAYKLWEPSYRYYQNFSQGLDAAEDESGYWDTLRQTLPQLMLQHPYYDRPTKILCMGDAVHDKRFQQALELSFQDINETLPDIFMQDARYAAAKGAAEFSRRGFYPLH
ncbi:MAG: hypothetical protein Q9181_004271 [Wetmoreana brouardii]